MLFLDVDGPLLPFGDDPQRDLAGTASNSHLARKRGLAYTCVTMHVEEELIVVSFWIAAGILPECCHLPAPAHEATPASMAYQLLARRSLLCHPSPQHPLCRRPSALDRA